MKRVLMTIVLALFSFPALAQGGGDAIAVLTPVKPEYVCMMNDVAFEKPQIPVDIGGNIYYGCCPMCKERLAQDANARVATDPVSGKIVDKASAVIGKAGDGKVYYFESEANLRSYKPTPIEKAHAP